VASPLGFAGSFLCVGGLIVVAMILFTLFSEPVVNVVESKAPSRTLAQIVPNPVFAIAVGACSISFLVMSLVMTATPLNMYEIFCIDYSNTNGVL